MNIRVVIPCYNEPTMLSTIESLLLCNKEDIHIEVIVVVNSYLISSSEIIKQNQNTYTQLKSVAQANNSSTFYITPLYIDNIPGHQTGAGLPRKIGMDKAVNDFYEENNPEGIIVSLDADTTVELNYFEEIYYNFKKYNLKSATIEYHHPTEHLPENDKLRIATEAYEEYLRYYRAALEYAGYPYAYYTIGSAFAVTAKTYKQVGGMGKQQAGEDFYFLQKVFPLGKTKFINTTKVYPAARISDRVPFGTGPAIAKMLEENQLYKLTYQVKAFEELKQLFDLLDSFFKQTSEDVVMQCKILPKHLQAFLLEDDFFSKVEEINQHTSSVNNFKKRFFNYFNAFKILKYLNAVHPNPYQLTQVKEQISLILPIL
ncbi:glycosyltransferase involved in cell wall biosynthesis [Dysgonomonadaceae bacterium PH5-43]|nr:glycosyltransferase involved in cell wall biosynthesis [Dysgonomonadaceae bacterium PH5-43]